MPYGYHLTTRNAALKIKEQGLLSMEKRLGVKVANPHGSFAKNQADQEPTYRANRLKKDIAALMTLGAKPAELLALKLDEIPIRDFDPLGLDPEAELVELDAVADKARKRFQDRLPAIKNKKLVTSAFVKVWKSPEAAQQVPIFQAQMTHFLTRLSVQYAYFHYRIEELQTSTHVYFSEPHEAVKLYPSYKKHLGADNPLVILRVDLAKVAWKPDHAQGGAVKVKDGVPVNLLEVMENHEKFVDEAYRMAPENWKPLSTLSGPAKRARPRIDYGWSPDATPSYV